MSNNATVDTSKIDEYVITIDRNTGTVDYSEMKNIGVSGVIIEAGCLYDVSHIAKTYKNPKLDSQVSAVSAAGLPYGFYGTVRARTDAEASKEVSELCRIARKYSPMLGVWLELELSKSKSTNNSIVDTYYRELSRAGLSGRIGFYATEEQLSKIDWDRYSETWYLWLNRHVDTMTNIEQVVTPQFFVL